MSSRTPVRRYDDELLDELVGPPTPRKPTSGIPPAGPGEHHMTFDEYSARVRDRGTNLRAKALPLSCSPLAKSNVRAREIYAAGVRRSGGASTVARNEGHNESAVRQRINAENVYPNLAHVICGLSPEGIVEVADALIALAQEKAAGTHGR